MKKLIPIILLFLAVNLQAQDYRCISDTNYLYIRPDKHFEGVHIDSIKLNNGDSIFYFHPIVKKTGYSKYVFTKSWIGEKAIISSDETIFYCDSIDTIVIKTKADTGFQWNFYKDYILAKVVKADTMTLYNGTVDSVKIIELIKNNISIPDSINGRKIILSKNYGLISFFKIADFNGKSYVTYNKTSQKLPTYFDFYKFEVGDIFQWKTGSSDYMSSYSTYTTDTITGITIFADSIVCKTKYSRFSCLVYNRQTASIPPWYIDSCTKRTYKVSEKSYKQGKIIEPNWPFYINVYPFEQIPIGCKFSDGMRSYILFLDNKNRLNFESIYETWDWYDGFVMIEGLGDVSEGSGKSGGLPSERSSSYSYLYAYKKVNGDTLGKFASKIAIAYENNISIYPNPARENFTIELPMEYETCQVELISADGSVVLSQKFVNSGQNVIETGNIAPGFYVVKIAVGGEVWYRKLIVE